MQKKCKKNAMRFFFKETEKKYFSDYGKKTTFYYSKKNYFSYKDTYVYFQRK